MLKNLIDVSAELHKPIVTSGTLKEYKLPSSLALLLKSRLHLNGLSIDAYTSSLKTSDTNFAVIPNQFFSFACYFYDFANELNKYFQLLGRFQEKCSSKHVDAAEILFGEWQNIKNKVESDADLLACFESNDDVELFCRFLDQTDKSYRLGAKNPINNNNGFSIRGHDDCFGSVVLTQINLPNASSSIFGDLVYALANAPEVFEKIKEHHVLFTRQSTSIGGEVSADTIHGMQLPKPFLLLAGISGTGKTRFVREQAKASRRDGAVENYSLIPVRPDWHEPSDLLGYVSRIGSNGSSRYVVTDLLKFVVQAWQDAAALAVASADALPCKLADEMTPFWLCLDEMNLAPVEQYFADYLSVVETRKWEGGSYTCDPLLKAATIEQLDAAGQQALRVELGLADAQFDGLWAYFVEVGIPLPPNLIVAGTVNMDETTHGFSRKVIDRAFTIDFGVFYPNDFAEFFEEDKINFAKTLGFPMLSRASKVELAGVAADAGGAKSIAFLGAINAVLRGSPFELAYRALNELLLALVCFNPKDDAELQAVWDDFLMSKVLPRIDGDAEKLGVENDTSLLTRLRDEVARQFVNKADTRPDLLRERKDGGVCAVAWRAEQKLNWMQTRLDANGFTTFWP
jgi:hypothetical protein